MFADLPNVKLSYEDTGSDEPVVLVIDAERCGHDGYLERPDVVNAAVLEFFDAGHR